MNELAADAFQRIYSTISTDMWNSLEPGQKRAIIMEAIHEAETYIPLHEFSKAGKDKICDHIMKDPELTATSQHSEMEAVLSGNTDPHPLFRTYACTSLIGGIERLDAMCDIIRKTEPSKDNKTIKLLDRFR